jgi:flavin-dependent dehydrogenase
MQSRDPVVVVGASGAGLFAALQLAQLGVPVQVYERTEILSPRERTLIVTPELQQVLGHSPEAATVNMVHTLELCANGRSVPIALREPDLIIERAALIRFLADSAVRAGAELVFGQSFTGLELDGNRTLVRFSRRGTDRSLRVPARAVIAADGVRSHVARTLGEPQRPTVSVLQARVSTAASADPRVGKVWFVPRETDYFYWLCPESPGTAAVGLVDINPRHVRRKLDAFLADHGYQPLEYQSALVPLYRPNPTPLRRIGRTDVLFIGDAAGQVKVTTVGGTVTGLGAARAAARAIAHGTNYLRELGGVQRELRLHWWIRSLMNRFRDQEYDALLRLLAGRATRLLEIHNRDRLAYVVWPILAAQPRLPLLAARALWRGSSP